VPPVFVLDNEPSINAFAAGHRPADAVVAVSRGALEYLTREELQGVMGHEFSHILNGDMRLNLRLIGVVNGILVLAIIGYYVMRSAGHASSGSSKKQGGAAGIFLFGAALCVLGYIGVFFGNLIKAAISRQREFLADAASVQFTRYPAGITGALKKIGGLDEGSRINDGHAEEISHMFFGDAFAGSFFNLFATHPPLADRIRCFEPEFDGSFPPVQPLRGLGDGLGKPSYAEAPARPARRGALPIGIPIGLPATAALSGAVSKQSTLAVVERTGRPQPEQLEQAGRLMEALPEPLVEAAREPFAARSQVYALLLIRDDT
jgi:hypothetical protein